MNNGTTTPDRFWILTRWAAMTVPLIGLALAAASGSTHAATSTTVRQDDFVGVFVWLISGLSVVGTRALAVPRKVAVFVRDQAGRIRPS